MLLESTFIGDTASYNRSFPEVDFLRIVISGASGFIGSHMCDRLVADGHAVIGLDNFLTSSERNIAHLRGNQAFQLIRHDITEPLAIDGPVDCVINMAS